MIIDLASVEEELALSCDLCIVGTGAAGLAIAHEMRNSSLQTVLVESGGLEHEPATQALYDVEISGLPHPGSTQGRFRVCGGSTTRWGGQALPLLPSDFERREWVAHSGWPITFDEMNPYYRRASEFLQIDSLNFDSDLFSYLRAIPPAFDPQKIWYHFSKWSPQPNLRQHQLARLRSSERCILLLHANVTEIMLEPNLERVAHLEVRSLQGRRGKVRSRAFILCTGGIETARLLLSNRKQQPRGIGNEHDLVGRYFQDHPNIFAGWLATSNPGKVQKQFNVFHKHTVKYSVRCTGSPRWQKEQRVLSTSMGIMFVLNGSALEDLKDVYRALRSRRLAGQDYGKLLHALSHPRDTVAPIWHFLRHGRSFTPGARFQVCLTCEQEPDPESRVQLGHQTDALGMPRADICWKITDLTWRTMIAFANLLQEEFRRLGIGEIALEPWLCDPQESWREHVMDQFHHMGTTRMNESPRQGVVDPHCRVHGISNLYIGSSAVFPTSGHSNPTLTIIALCIRLADRLKQELAS